MQTGIAEYYIGIEAASAELSQILERLPLFSEVLERLPGIAALQLELLTEIINEQEEERRLIFNLRRRVVDRKTWRWKKNHERTREELTL